MKFEPASIERLFEQQQAAWPLLARGLDGLKHAQTRTVDVNGYTVLVRHLPHRIASTTAAVDVDSVAKRACFLCTANLPPEQKGLPFNPEYTVYCNPFPILDRHLTIIHNMHRPQRIAGQVEKMFRIAEALPEYLIIYNGPESGASAPDHMHFQACLKNGFPLVADTARSTGMTIPNYARHPYIVKQATPALIESAIQHLNQAAPRDPEPLLNLALFRHGSDTVAVLFPRSKHRPEAFHSGKFTVSPATIDLCGVFVAPVERDFERLTGEDIREIYEEVTCDYPSD